MVLMQLGSKLIQKIDAIFSKKLLTTIKDLLHYYSG